MDKKICLCIFYFTFTLFCVIGIFRLWFLYRTSSDSNFQRIFYSYVCIDTFQLRWCLNQIEYLYSRKMFANYSCTHIHIVSNKHMVITILHKLLNVNICYKWLNKISLQFVEWNKSIRTSHIPIHYICIWCNSMGMNLCVFFCGCCCCYFLVSLFKHKSCQQNIVEYIIYVHIYGDVHCPRICNVFILVRGTDFRVRFFVVFRFLFFSYQNLFTRIKQNSKQYPHWHILHVHINICQ